MEEKKFEKNTFSKRIKSMLKTDLKRLFVSPFFYITLGVTFVAPVLILVMTTMMSGTVSINPQTGEETVMRGFDYAWQIFGSLSGSASEKAEAGMDLVSMCNINMTYFAIAALVCLFVCGDFKSGYAKNLFTVRSKKTDYVLSKTLVCSLGGAAMIAVFALGSVIGGGVAGLPFTMEGFSAYNLVCCLLAKILLVPIFVSVFLAMSVAAKQKTWLALCLSCGVGAFLFTIISIVSPLNAGLVHVCLSLVGSATFSAGLGAVSNAILKKTSLV